MPKIGPFRSLGFSVPTRRGRTPVSRKLHQTREHFRESLDALQAGRLRLPNTDFDTGLPTRRGEYSLADATYDELLGKLADRGFADMPRGLSANIVAYYRSADIPSGIGEQVAQLKATCSCY